LDAQNLIRDFISGFFILLENQYRIGDVIVQRAFQASRGYELADYGSA
jgi:small-conductance mechanosensitive channel